MTKAVIFDMDGVIVDSEPIHIEAEKRALLKYGVKITTEELRMYTGTTAEFEFNDLIRKYKLNANAETLFNEKMDIMFRLLEKGIEPTKGVTDLIKNLKQQGFKLGIATSGHRKLAHYYLNKLGMASFFDTVVCAEDITRSKPDPEIFLKAAQRLGVEPAKCVVIEDAKLGIEAAAKAGMKRIGYRNPNSGNQDLSKADFIVSDFTRLTPRLIIELHFSGHEAKAEG
jgi:beta-phosphoglucomutase family hydrolase